MTFSSLQVSCYQKWTQTQQEYAEDGNSNCFSAAISPIIATLGLFFESLSSPAHARTMADAQGTTFAPDQISGLMKENTILDIREQNFADFIRALDDNDDSTDFRVLLCCVDKTSVTNNIFSTSYISHSAPRTLKQKLIHIALASMRPMGLMMLFLHRFLLHAAA